MNARWLIAGVATLLAAGAIVAYRGDDGSSGRAVAGSTDGHAVATSAANTSGHQGADAMGHKTERKTEKQAEFHDAMRKLWEDHVTWTRLFIVSASADLPDLEATTERLLRNQADIGDATKPYYGNEAGEQLTVLLEEHITTAGALLAAAKSGDADAVNAAGASWYDNSDRIAAFLSSANPDHWLLSDAKAMMREHLDLTLKEATAHLTGDYATDIKAYDRIHEQILEMADMLSGGIIAQFPEKFE